MTAMANTTIATHIIPTISPTGGSFRSFVLSEKDNLKIEYTE